MSIPRSVNNFYFNDTDGFGFLRRFLADDSGMVSADWALVAALCAGLGYGVTEMVGDGARELADKLQARYAHLSVEMRNADGELYDLDGALAAQAADSGALDVQNSMDLSFSR